MKETTIEDIDNVRELARLNGFLPDLRAVINKKLELILHKMCGAVDRGELTPEMAFTAWHEVHAYQKVLYTFDKKARIVASETKDVRLDEGDKS